MSDPRPVLYSFRRCPYAMRARLAVASAGITCRLREVVLRDKPAEMIAVSPKATVPVLVTTTGVVLDESLDIMIWALQQNDPEDWLAPDADAADETRALIETCDGPFKRALDRYKYPNRYGDENIDPHHQRGLGLDFLRSLSTRLEKQPYLFGPRPALADMAILPFVRQFANADRAWFDALPLEALQAWLDTHLNSARFAAAMKKYPQWTTGAEEPVFPDSRSADLPS